MRERERERRAVSNQNEKNSIEKESKKSGWNVRLGEGWRGKFTQNCCHFFPALTYEHGMIRIKIYGFQRNFLVIKCDRALWTECDKLEIYLQNVQMICACVCVLCVCEFAFVCLFVYLLDCVVCAYGYIFLLLLFRFSATARCKRAKNKKKCLLSDEGKS